MRLPLTLSFYIGRQFLLAFAIALVTILLIVGLIELVELIRRAAHKEYTVPFSIIVEMTLMKIPFTAEQILPFAVLIGTMLSLTKLTKSSELVIARASGVSVWQFLAPAVACAICIGMVFIGVCNPISSAMISRFETLEGKYITNRPSVLSVLPSGLWLRQVENLDTQFGDKPVREYIIHAQRISQQDMSLSNVIIFLYGEEHVFIGRIDAPRATLLPGKWQIDTPMLSAPSILSRHENTYTLKTDLNINQIKESYSSPKTLSFWELPGFIHVLEKAGFSALRHRLHWQTQLATPFMLCSMVFIGAVFSLRHYRRGKIGMLIALGLLAGFIVYFVSNLVYALGFSGSLPIGLAAWTPPLVASMIGVSLLLHYEDG